MQSITITETILRRDRAIVIAALALILALSWAYLLMGAGTGMSTIAMTTLQFPPPADIGGHFATWSGGYWLIMLAMWWVMMVAMMTPSATPMILLYARVVRRGQAREQIADPLVPTAVFAIGYLSAWLAFSVLATILQWLLERSGLVSSMMMWSNSTRLSGILLIIAGLYQLTPLKAVCLEHCRAPADFLSRHWRPGRRGALRLGLWHGTYCLGCCWGLMLLLFVGGTMNLIWIAGLAGLVLVEKLLPGGRTVALGLAAVLLVAGVYLVAAA